MVPAGFGCHRHPRAQRAKRTVPCPGPPDRTEPGQTTPHPAPPSLTKPRLWHFGATDSPPRRASEPFQKRVAEAKPPQWAITPSHLPEFCIQPPEIFQTLVDNLQFQPTFQLELTDRIAILGLYILVTDIRFGILLPIQEATRGELALRRSAEFRPFSGLSSLAPSLKSTPATASQPTLPSPNRTSTSVATSDPA